MKANLEKLRSKRMSLTERELHILAVSVTEMQAAGYWPFTDKFIVQVETWKKVNSFTMFCLFNWAELFLAIVIERLFWTVEIAQNFRIRISAGQLGCGVVLTFAHAYCRNRSILSPLDGIFSRLRPGHWGSF